MELKVHIPFNQLLAIAKQLSPAQKNKLKKELEISAPANVENPLKKLLLQGPVFTDAQIKTIEDTHKSINEWRKP